MAKVPEGVDPEQLTVVARRVLLDGLEALREHRDAITVVGAQAVYLRTPDAAVRSAAFTSDGDLTLDPARLPDRPLLDEALRGSGFELLQASQPGLWGRTEQIGERSVLVELDLLVPETLVDRGRRSAKIPPHDTMSARWIRGLEVAVEDRSPLTITSLETADQRKVTVNVAGTVALLVAKAFKISDRLADEARRPDRLTNKDAGDVLRLFMGTRASQAAADAERLRSSERVGAIAKEGLDLLADLFGRPGSRGVDMAVQALAADIPEARIRALAPAFTNALRDGSSGRPA
ncbi:hypothetical protein [Streptacidiphilus jiangxiensis]|uniref:Nucleotidyltransferase n=1 Tax=Streptacidiphilus jiangxiensis TaxID=235985 RepID=A0A1H8B365_STRJI|nr:hypothetical protein [Streptacidiphilus jiangxiensis]SEM76544.1 hypothetical protein SAMN05414137_1554 [Streptacidiphilus jiangxiensis]